MPSRSRPRAPRGGRPARRHSRLVYESRFVSGEDSSIAREIDYIVSCAARDAVHVVGLGPLVFFSAAGGRAWVLDTEDSLAHCLMHDHVPRTSPLRGETARDYALAWEEEFAIDEGCFWTFSPDGTATAHRGVPVDEIERTIRLARAHRSR
jgi:hypothetical protein